MGIVGGKSADLPTEEGTKKITEGILKTEAYTVVGGGDTLEYLNKLGVLDKFSFASTGGEQCSASFRAKSFLDWRLSYNSVRFSYINHPIRADVYY